MGKISAIILAATALTVVLSSCGGEQSMNNNPESASSSTEAAATSTTGTASPAEAKATPATGQVIQPEKLAQELLGGNYSGIHAQFSPDFKAQISEAEVAEMGAAFIQGIRSLEPTSVLKLNGMEQRVWTSDDGGKGVLAVFDEAGMILGLNITGLTPYPESDSLSTKTVIGVPFREELLVFWGGSNVLDNYHYEHESQRYAYDFVQAVDGFSYTGDPLKNESYHAFGLDILAPADGTVASVLNDIPDNTPVGVMNEKEPAGNLVVIDHGGEYSYLAHLKQGSITVKPGDQVKAGAVIGQLGNSGNSSEPHLHFQVSDGADLFESRSLNIQWQNNLHPLRGETVTGAPSTDS